MSKEKLQELYDLLTELKNERMDQYADLGHDVIEMDPEDLYDLDDGDNLLCCADGVLGVLETKLAKDE